MLTVQPYFEQDNLTLYCGDLREVLLTLPRASVDFVVTDPPYGLSFMEKDWDHDVPGPEYWRAIARVCKPGAMMLAFGGTRTYHRLTCAIEDAGWEIRDALMWLYGQGMPKGGDIGKLIDKAKVRPAQGCRHEVGKARLPSLADNGRTNEVYGDLPQPPGRIPHAPSRPRPPPKRPKMDRLGDGPEAGLGADCPGDEAAGRHDCPQCACWGVAGMNIEASRIGTESTIRTRGDSLTDAGWASTNRSPLGGSECGELAGEPLVGRGCRPPAERRLRRREPFLLLRQGNPEGARAGQRPPHRQALGPYRVSTYAPFNP